MRRIVTALAVTAAACLSTVPAAAARTAGAVTHAGALSAPVVTGSRAARRTVVLPTGDAVAVSTVSGRPTVSVHAAEHSGLQGAFLTESMAGHTYVLPAEARPFLGRILDPSLFDVTALASSAGSGRIPVTVTAATGAAIRLPGFTASSHSGSVVTGYLARASAPVLRRALVSAWRRAVTPGAVAPASLFGGVTHLALVGAPAPVTPDFPQVTLVIKVVDSDGKPASGGEIQLLNTDDGRKFVGFVPYENGAARVSLPYGHYSGLTDVFDVTSNSDLADRIVPIADYTVARNLQALTFDARTATARPSVHTPRSADLSDLTVEYDRDDARNGGLAASFSYGPGFVVYVAPTAQARVGRLYWVTTWSLVGAPVSGPSYSYDLSFLDTGSVPVRQSHPVSTSQLATVNARYYSDPPRQAQFVRSPFYPFQFGVSSSFTPLATPTRRTEYVYSPPAAVWLASYLAYPTDDNPFGGSVSDGFRSYSPGSTRTVDWLRGPLAPATPAWTSGDTFYSCPACRTPTTLSVFLAPVTDTTPGHAGDLDEPEGGGPVADFAVYRDGTRIGGGADVAGGLFTVPTAAATYHIHDTTDRRTDPVLTSTATSTDLTFRSAASGGASRPAGWQCGIGHAARCTVLPLLHATVPLPTSLLDTLPVGATTFDFTVARIQGSAPATVTAATLSTSTDGRTFHAARVTALGAGTFRTTIVNQQSSTGRGVSVRVTGSDAGGSTIVQTVTDAYIVAAA